MEENAVGMPLLSFALRDSVPQPLPCGNDAASPLVDAPTEPTFTRLVDASHVQLYDFKSGHRGVMYKKHLYKKNSQRKDKLYWRCQDRKCRARLTTSLPPTLSLLHESGTHTCGLIPDPTIVPRE